MSQVNMAVLNRHFGDRYLVCLIYCEYTAVFLVHLGVLVATSSCMAHLGVLVATGVMTDSLGVEVQLMENDNTRPFNGVSMSLVASDTIKLD